MLEAAASCACSGKPDGLYPAVDDPTCTGYCNCFQGSAPVQYCAAGLRFNPTPKVCDFAANVPCGSTAATPTAVNPNPVVTPSSAPVVTPSAFPVPATPTSAPGSTPTSVAPLSTPTAVSPVVATPTKQPALYPCNPPCSGTNNCCSKWGYCGAGDDYCGVGCQPDFSAAGACANGAVSTAVPMAPTPTWNPAMPTRSAGPTMVPLPPGECDITQVFTQAAWDAIFPFIQEKYNACPVEARDYTYASFIAATKYYPDFGCQGTTNTRLREIVAFLAHASQETTGGWATAPGGPYAWGLCFVQEQGCGGGGCDYCDASNTQFPCVPGQWYHGRGPIQLSWNYNYGLIGQNLGLGQALLQNPNLVLSDPVLGWRTALDFWMTPQFPKPSCHAVMAGLWQPSANDAALGRVPGFGMTTNIINGGLECGPGNAWNQKPKNRANFFTRSTDIVGILPGEFLLCDTMAPYA